MTSDECLLEQSIRVDSHPSLVKSADTVANAGAGSVINMPEQLDPGLKPYMLQYDGASTDAIISTIKFAVGAIDKMANTGAVRATESKTLSGVAMQTEFQLLNARLSGKADNLELAEEQMWRLFANYQDKAWDGEVVYPDSFNIQDTQNEIIQLKDAKEIANDAGLIKVIDKQLALLLGEDPDEILTGTETSEIDVDV